MINGTFGLSTRGRLRPLEFSFHQLLEGRTELMVSWRVSSIALLAIVLLVTGCAAQPSNTTVTVCV